MHIHICMYKWVWVEAIHADLTEPNVKNGKGERTDIYLTFKDSQWIFQMIWRLYRI